MLAMTINEFAAKFGSNEARKALLSELGAFIDRMAQNFKRYRVLVYGSFIGEKEQPTDIDVLIWVCAEPCDPGFNMVGRPQELAPPDVDVFAVGFSHTFAKCPDAPSPELMIEQFNNRQAHLEKGIRCSNAVELLLEPPNNAP